MKIDPINHNTFHADIEAGWPEYTFRAKVKKVISSSEIEIEVGSQKFRVGTKIPLEEGATLLLRALPDKSELQLLQVIPKRSDFSFLASLDIFRTESETLLALANFDTKLKQRLIEQIFDQYVQKRLLRLHAKLSQILADTPNDSKILALLVDLVKSKKLKADKIERLLHLHKKEHEEVIKTLQILAEDQPDKASYNMVMEVAQMLQNYWLLGQMGNAYVGYLPLDWPDLEESRILIKRLVSRPVYLCKIHLGFTEHGRVDVTLVLHRRYLSVVIGIENEEYRDIIQNSRHELKLQLQAMGVMANILVKKFVQEDLQSFLIKESFMDLKV